GLPRASSLLLLPVGGTDNRPAPGLVRVASARRVSRRPVSSMITLDDGTAPPGPSQPGFLSPAGRRSADVLTGRLSGRSPPKSALDGAGAGALGADARVG